MSLFGFIQLAITFIFVFVVLKFIFPGRGVKQITVNKLKEKMTQDDDIQLIDVRHPAKYSQFHIYGFNNIPLTEIKKHTHLLTTDKAVITVCQTGMQGNQACKKLKRLGFTNLSNVRGGLSTWTPIHIDRS